MEVEIPIKPTNFSQFQQQWKQKYPWVNCIWEYKVSEGQWEEVLYCKSCVTYYSKLQQSEKSKFVNSFIQGCRSIKLTRLEEHEGAKKSCHLEADKTFHPERYQKQQDIIGEMFASKKTRIEDRLLLPLFANAFFLAKQNVAILKFEKLKQLFSFLEVEQNSNYFNCHACTDIQSSIQSTICDKLYSTTSPVSKKIEFIAITCRYLDSSNEIQERFLAIKELNNFQASSFVEEINNALQELNIYQHLYFLSTDGASVVSSDKNGVYGKLKYKIPYLLANKCLAHRASLGVKDLAKDQLVGKDEDVQLLQMIKPIDVRWISYYPSMKRLLQNLHPVLKTISDLNKEDFSIEYTSDLLYFKQISNIIFIGYYTVILNHIYILTKTLQKRNISIEVFQFEYNKCLECLNRLKELNIDENNSIIEEEITTDQYSIGLVSKLISKRITKQTINNKEVFLLDEELVLQGKGNYSDHFVTVKEIITPMIDFLIQQLKIRFENNDFINNFDCLNIEAIKKLSQTEVDNFGNKQIANLIKFYKQNGCKGFIKFDEKSILPNYLELKYQMKE
ncbi:hypothetical protein ABPG72_020842 [Tetrahymena utriculariae]